MTSTADFSKPVHGTIPQNLIEKIVRMRIYESRYWKEHCFGLTGELLVDKAVQLQYFGGVCSENNKPTPFFALLLKMLQIQPELDIVLEFVRNEEYKYVRALGLFYLRLTGTPLQIYKELEPHYNDYRKLAFQTKTGWRLTFMDEWVDNLLHDDIACNIVLPRLAKRVLLEEAGQLPPRVSPLQGELEHSESDGSDSDSGSSLSSDSVSSDEDSSDESESVEDEESISRKEADPISKESDPVMKNNDMMDESKDDDASKEDRSKRKRSKKEKKEKKKKKDKKKKKKKKKNKHKKARFVVKGLKSTPAVAPEEAGNGDKVIEGSVEYWNQQREKLGLKRLKD